MWVLLIIPLFLLRGEEHRLVATTNFKFLNSWVCHRDAKSKVLYFHEMVNQAMENKRYREQVKLAAMYHDRGIDYCYVERDGDKALVELRKAVLLRESVLGKYSNDTALSYFRLACVLWEEKKDHREALVSARREFRIWHSLVGLGASSCFDGSDKLLRNLEGWISDRMSWIKNVLMESDDSISSEKACSYCNRLLESVEYEKSGDVHTRAQRWELAMTQYNCSLAIESAATARNVLDVADLQVKLGFCMLSVRDIDGAIAEFRSALSKYSDAFGELHGEVARIQVKLGNAYLQNRMYDSALGSFAKAYSAFEKTHGEHYESSRDVLQDIRLVTVKEMEDLRQQERHRLRWN